jgi:hypothetical protein
MVPVLRPTTLAAVLLAIPPMVFAEGACDLISPEELQATLGAKPNLKASTLPSGVQVCTGKAGTSTVTIRLYARKDDAEREKEAAGLEALKKAGATVETRRVAGFNCMELRPGGKAARQAYTTSCATASTAKAPKYAVIEVSNPSQSLEMRKLAPLAESIAAKLF